MRLALAIALLFSCGAVHAQDALETDVSVLVMAPEGSLVFVLEGTDVPSEAIAEIDAALGPLAAGNRASAAWRGAKRGGAIGLGAGAMLVILALAVDAQEGGCSRGDYFCATPVAVLATVPLTLIGAGIGAAIGASTSGARGPSAR